MSEIILRRLSRFYEENAVVDRLDLTIGSGEFLSLLGASGCGKTTTLRMIAGFVEPSEGQIEVDRKVVSSPSRTLPPEDREMSMIFQSYAIWPHMTIQANVEFGLKVRRIKREELKRRVAEVLEIVRLGHLAGRYPSELSGGQQQRVALARAIAVRPKVLLLDEPLSNLDASLRDDMCREIRKLHDELKLTTIYVTHDQSEAMRVSDRIAVMNSGRIEQVSTPQELYGKPETEFVARFIGKTNILDIQKSGEKFSIGGLPSIDLRLEESQKQKWPCKLSLRPHDIELSVKSFGQAEHPEFKVVVAEASYRGDTWHYNVHPENGQQALAISAPVSECFSVGQSLWARLKISKGEFVRV